MPEQLGPTADEFSSAVVDAAPDGILIVDRTGAIRYANRKACDLFARPRDQLEGGAVDELLPAGLRSSHAAQREQYATAPSVRPMGAGLLLRAVRSTGEEFPVEVSLSPLGSGRDTVVVAVVRDVTERVEADARLRQIEGQMSASELALREAEQLVALADERERIARELHDTVIQRLFASGLQLQAVVARLDPETAARVERVVDDLDETIREIRMVIFALQSAPQGASTRGRISEVVSDEARALGFDPRLRFDGPLETLDDAVVDDLVPTVREALSNIARHARASKASVEITVDDDVVLLVDDDGIGLEADHTLGQGLENMRNRAEGLGGAIRVGPSPLGGTRLEWRVPATRHAAAD